MDIRGWFYFRQNKLGKLDGQFSNNKVNLYIFHSAEALGETTDFIGEYDSLWEVNNQKINMKLNIKVDINNRIILTWYDGKEIIYQGLGYILDGILIGNYNNKKL